jgi:hypothetical protein
MRHQIKAALSILIQFIKGEKTGDKPNLLFSPIFDPSQLQIGNSDRFDNPGFNSRHHPTIAVSQRNAASDLSLHGQTYGTNGRHA